VRQEASLKGFQRLEWGVDSSGFTLGGVVSDECLISFGEIAGLCAQVLDCFLLPIYETLSHSLSECTEVDNFDFRKIIGSADGLVGVNIPIPVAVSTEDERVKRISFAKKFSVRVGIIDIEDDWRAV
jgi:hypothetical protein